MQTASTWRVTVRFFEGGSDVWVLTAASRSEAGDKARERLWQGEKPVGMVQQILPAGRAAEVTA